MFKLTLLAIMLVLQIAPAAADSEQNKTFHKRTLQECHKNYFARYAKQCVDLDHLATAVQNRCSRQERSYAKHLVDNDNYSPSKALTAVDTLKELERSNIITAILEWRISNNYNCR